MSTGMKILLAVLFAAAVGAVIIFVLTKKHGFSALLLNALGGTAALFAVNITGLLTGIQLAVNRWSLAVGAMLGVPGVASMLVLDVLFKGRA